MAVWRGGAKNKAPYKSTHVRVPVPIKSKVQALIDEFKKDIEGFKKSEPKLSESSLTGLEENEEEENEEEDSSEPSDLETIKSQAEMIRAYVSEIHFLKHKLEQLSLLTSLDDAKKEARKQIRAKDRKTLTVANLLSEIYKAEVTEEEMT